MLKLFIDGVEQTLTRQKFPGGETLLRIENTPKMPRFDIIARIELHFRGNDDLIDLALLTDAVRRQYRSASLFLVMPYLPYARQDRVCARGESLSIKVIANLINSLDFTGVICDDIHSDVGGALINNLTHRLQHQLALKVAENHPDVVLVAPDAGALKKVHAFAQAYGYTHVLHATKHRDPRTGAITHTSVAGGFSTVDMVILDDICDGGRTFVELAKELEPMTTGRLFLYVTHGIFSNGYDELEKYFERIYVSNLMGEHHPLVEVV